MEYPHNNQHVKTVLRDRYPSLAQYLYNQSLSRRPDCIKKLDVIIRAKRVDAMDEAGFCIQYTQVVWIALATKIHEHDKASIG